jgi:hypothetical protein
MTKEEIKEKIKEVDKRLANSTSYKNRNDLLKYKQRLLKELNRCEKSGKRS